MKNGIKNTEFQDFNLNGINLNAKCIGDKTLTEYLDGNSLEAALLEQRTQFNGAIEEGIADSLMYDRNYAPEFYKAEMQNIDILLPNKEVRDYVVSLVNE